MVDAAIQPLADVSVTLLGADLRTTTNENGAFLFDDLEPGTYFLEARKVGYIKAQSNAEVVAGVASPDVVKVQLAFDPQGTPYYNAYSFEGFIQCGTNIAAACGGVRDFTGLGDDTYSSLYDTENNITHLQTEMVWENTQAFGDSFSVSHRYATPENHAAGFYDGGITSGSGPSPLLIVTDAVEYNKNNVGEDYEFLLSVFAGTSETVPVFGLAVNQKYQMFIHEFHGYAPPEGWRFTDGTSVPGPQ